MELNDKLTLHASVLTLDDRSGRGVLLQAADGTHRIWVSEAELEALQQPFEVVAKEAVGEAEVGPESEGDEADADGELTGDSAEGEDSTNEPPVDTPAEDTPPVVAADEPKSTDTKPSTGKGKGK